MTNEKLDAHWKKQAALLIINYNSQKYQFTFFNIKAIGDGANRNWKNNFFEMNIFFLRIWPWLVWLNGLSASLWTKGSLVWFPVRAHAWVAGQTPLGGAWEATTHWCFSPSLSPSLPSVQKLINKTLKNNLVIFSLFNFLWVKSRLLSLLEQKLNLF